MTFSDWDDGSDTWDLSSDTWDTLDMHQGPPFYDTTNPNLTGFYSNQLNFIGNSGPVTYTTTLPSSSLVVYPNGFLTTTGVLESGTYTVAGSGVDGASNNGLWEFTLTVASNVAAGAVLQPQPAPIPFGTVISVPFRVDPATGGIAVISDYGKIVRQNIETIVMTAIGERIMLPLYGSDMQRAQFAPISGASITFLQQDIQTAIAKWEPAANILSVSVFNDASSGPEVLTVKIEFSVLPFNTVNTVTVTSGGGIFSVVNQ